MIGNVFVSYSRSDTKYVKRLTTYLRDAGLPVWMDDKIDLGERWATEIRDQVDACAVFVVVMSAASENSDWVDLEISRAASKGKPILPLLLGGDAFFRLANLQYEDVRDGRLPGGDFVDRVRQFLAGPPDESLAALERYDPLPEPAPDPLPDPLPVSAPAPAPTPSFATAPERTVSGSRRWRWISIAGSAVAVMLILVVVQSPLRSLLGGGGPQGPGSTGTQNCGLKIGFFGALSGNNAGLITPSRNGASMAVDKYNASHANCKVSLADFDSQGSQTLAPALAVSATNDTKIVAMIGPAFSGESTAAGPIFEQAGLPTITPTANRPALSTYGWKTFHRGVGDDMTQGPAVGRYIKDTLKATKVFLVSDDTTYGIGLVDKAGSVLGSAIVGTEKVKTGDRIFSALVGKVMGSGATVMFFGGYTEEASPLLKQLRAGGWTGAFVGADGINDNNMISATGKAEVEGTISTCPCAPATKAKGTFANDYKAKFGIEPGVYADVAFDLTTIFLDGIGQGKVTRADLQAFLATYRGMGPASGVTYSWDSTGELDPSQVVTWVFVARDGAWASVAPVLNR